MKAQEKLVNNQSGTRIKILFYIVLFLVLFGVNNTSIYYTQLTPFGIGIVFALMLFDFSGYTLSIIFAISYMLTNFSLNNMLIAINVSVVLSILELFKSSGKIKLNKLNVFVFALLSQILYIATSIGDTKEILALFVSIILGMIFLYICICFCSATINRCMVQKLNLDEKICGSVILIIFILGMSSTNIGIINLGLVFVSFLILIFSYLSSFSTSLIISVMLGIGFAISTISTDYITLFITLSVSAIAFRCNQKFLSAIALVVTYIMYSIIFSLGLSVGEVLSTIIGSLFFILTPKKILNYLSETFNIKSQVIYKNIINRSKKNIVKRVSELSIVFDEMDKVYRKMVRGNLSDSDAISMLKNELIRCVCDKCENKDLCFRKSGSFIDNSIDTLMSVGYEKKKVLLIDLPEYLASNCTRINSIMGVLNSMLSSYTEYTGVVSNLDSSRILIADQLSGVSKLLESLSREVDTNITFDTRNESRIKEELAYLNIVCLECVVYEKDIQTKNINLIIKTDTIDEKKIETTVSKITKCRMCIQSIEPSEVVGASIVNMITKPNYDISFGSCVVNKFGKVVCGDSYSFVKIEDGKFLVSICDGMGSGESAHTVSRLTISLIENFYRAGFDNDIILSSVNKLLSINEDENFSTIDLCIIDGRKNIYDFIKHGATTGYLKRDLSDVEEITSSGLPVGVLEEIKPHIIKKYINPMDTIILVSDGIADSFSDGELKRFISATDSKNPQSFSEKILSEAMKRNGNIPRDDMTVLCVRVFESV